MKRKRDFVRFCVPALFLADTARKRSVQGILNRNAMVNKYL